ncbi:MAG TPA: carbohydrate ABC transporter permease [Fimbriimonadaceae bacterium]|jgi:ABC-type glycerol-3-phosphate transport system permease component
MTPEAAAERSQVRAVRNSIAWEKILKVVAIVLLVVGSIIFLVPFLSALNMSLKSEAELKTTSAWALAQHPTLDNYKEVLNNPNVSFVQCFWNTFVIAFLTSLGVIISSSLVAYAFARLRFRGRDRLFLIMLSTMMLPTIITMIPTYLLFAQLRWINTFYPLIVPAWFGGGAFNIFLLRQFFMSVPRELDEAALLDGASHFTIWRRIIMPLSKTALATVGVFAFIFNWRDFLAPLIYLNDPHKQTLELGLQTFNAAQQQKYHLLMAGSVLVMLPLVLIFFLGQRYFVKGIVMSGIK